MVTNLKRLPKPTQTQSQRLREVTQLSELLTLPTSLTLRTVLKKDSTLLLTPLKRTKRRTRLLSVNTRESKRLSSPQTKTQLTEPSRVLVRLQT